MGLLAAFFSRRRRHRDRRRKGCFIAIGRQFAGIHWRSDGTEGIKLAKRMP